VQLFARLRVGTRFGFGGDLFAAFDETCVVEGGICVVEENGAGGRWRGSYLNLGGVGAIVCAEA